jgi:lipoate-protein ligase A
VAQRTESVSESYTKPGVAQRRFERTVERYELTDRDIRAIMKLREEKYSTWEWNYGYSPKYSYSNKIYSSGGMVESQIDVNGGVMTGVKFYGDFFALRDITEIETALTGVKHEREAATRVFERFSLNEFFSGFTADELLRCIGLVL